MSFSMHSPTTMKYAADSAHGARGEQGKMALPYSIAHGHLTEASIRKLFRIRNLHINPKYQSNKQKRNYIEITWKLNRNKIEIQQKANKNHAKNKALTARIAGEAKGLNKLPIRKPG